MKIIVDGFGGDNAPLAVLKGSAMAVAEYGVEIEVVGDVPTMEKLAKENAISMEHISLYQADGVIIMEDKPDEIIKSKRNCSMAVGLKRLKEGEGDAFVSGGSTGALVVGATFLVKRIKGVKRAALAAMIPGDAGSYMLLDVGANLECKGDVLTQFGVMGSVYMKNVMGVASPKVGLLNVGTEDTKGPDNYKEANEKLQKAPLQFVGNVEAREISTGAYDVVVADGFVGNAVLKNTEGLAKMFSKNLKNIFLSSFGGKIAALLTMKGVKDFKKKFDYKETGGAPLLGTSKPVFKAHGSSNEVAFKNAIRQAKDFAEKDVIGKISADLSSMKELLSTEPETETVEG